MNRSRDIRVVVTALAFSQNNFLRASLRESFPNSTFNDGGVHHDTRSLIDALASADGVVVGGDLIDENLLTHCPNLKIVAKYGVGMDNIDIAACNRHSVDVKWTPGVNKISVAEQTIGFMLALSRNLLQSSLSLKSGTWRRDGGMELSGKTVGIIGVGNIGREVIRLLEPFECRILVNDILDQDEYCRIHGALSVTKECLFSESDIVSIHTPLTESTRHMVNKSSLSLMKKSAILINTARGPIVNESDLKAALVSGTLRGAGVDVYEEEPSHDLSLLQLPNLFCTPHIGGNSIEAVHAMGVSAIEGLKEFFSLYQAEDKSSA